MSSIIIDTRERATMAGPDDCLVTKKQAAELLNVTTKTIDNWSRLGYFKRYRLRSEVRFLKSDLLNAWVVV